MISYLFLFHANELDNYVLTVYKVFAWRRSKIYKRIRRPSMARVGCNCIYMLISKEWWSHILYVLIFFVIVRCKPPLSRASVQGNGWEGGHFHGSWSDPSTKQIKIELWKKLLNKNKKTRKKKMGHIYSLGAIFEKSIQCPNGNVWLFLAAWWVLMEEADRRAACLTKMLQGESTKIDIDDLLQQLPINRTQTAIM